MTDEVIIRMADETSKTLSRLEFFVSAVPFVPSYNALLQGQFRHSDVRVQGDDLAHTQAEAWVGIATTWSDLRIEYALHYASAEMTTEPGRRGLIAAFSLASFLPSALLPSSRQAADGPEVHSCSRHALGATHCQPGMCHVA